MNLVDLPSAPSLNCNLVGGEFLPSSTGRTKDIISPYTGAVVSRVVMSSADDLEQVVAAARKAFPQWRDRSLKDRTQIMFRFRELMLRDIDSLAHIAASESGKTVAEAKAGILKGIEVMEFALSLQNMDSGGRMEVSRGVWCHYKREPLGIVAGVVPFNFPAMVPLWMFPIAVTLGNCFIMKPSEKVPSTMSRMAALMLEAGFPHGVFSVINGDREIVEALTDHSDVKAIGFVGSTPAARSVYMRASEHGKRALCLGGAKNHLIVVPDADESITVQGVIDSFTGCAGQRCMAASIMVAVGDVDHLIRKIVAEASARTIGTSMGAIIDAHAHARICAEIARAKEEGATLLLDGRGVTPPPGYEGGYWLGPTIIDNAKPQMACACHEIFGPVLTIIRVPTLGDALQLDALSPYGNATSVFTTSGAVASAVCEQATSGMVGVNVGVPVPREPFSFGGTKDSKFGHGDITGPSSLDFWTNLKKITTKWNAQSQNWMS